MTDNPHRIIRQVLELDFGHTAQFLELQQTAARVLQDQGLVAMESVFNQLAGPNQLVRLERLEIDLGELRGRDWSSQFSRRLAERLQHSLEQALQGQTSTSSTTSVSATAEDSLFEQFLFFCQQGRLPWWGSKPSDQWLETLQTTMTPAQWRTLAIRLRHNRRALRRLVYTASDRFLQTFLQRLNDISDAARVLVLLRAENWPRPAQSLWRERFWTTVLGYFTAATTADGQPLMRELLVERQTIFKAYGSFIPEADVSNINTNRVNTQENFPPLPSPWQSWLEGATQPQRPDSQSLTPTELTAGEFSRPAETFSAEAAAQDESSYPDYMRNSPHESSNRPSEPPETASCDPSSNQTLPGSGGKTEELSRWSRDDARGPAISDSPTQSNLYTPTSTQTVPPTEANEDIYVEGAGMVILHPFLQELFNSLDLLEDRRFRDQLSQRRAIALLTYLTFSEIDIPEYELLLPKLLCAWPWENPLPPYDLSEAEHQACDELLSAVLRHWSALRSSSAEWLRQGFFWRDGKLTPVGRGWSLTVECRAQDVLLNKLPWGIGVIRLPWMTDFLHVSWSN